METHKCHSFLFIDNDIYSYLFVFVIDCLVLSPSTQCIHMDMYSYGLK